MPALSTLHTFEFRALLESKRRKLLREAAGIPQTGQLRDIELALARIGDASYGRCTGCGGEIGRALLKTDPAAERCLPCQHGIRSPAAKSSAAK